MSMSLAALADLAEEEGRGTVELFAPRVRFRSVGHSDLDACLDWFAELVMTVDIDDADDVVVGSLDFTVIRLAPRIRSRCAWTSSMVIARCWPGCSTAINSPSRSRNSSRP
ncbi:hypothetical protein ACH47B_26630 [Rhodococcus sp. NPDC019627]|uniref:hypothetical protein n=1 Tax=unclassified Rhodococcus (in: high G+C Gram-positive bacteria) TaxID=192944 RepID=UPI0034036AD8